MKPLSSILILTVIVFASACSKGNYAQVEPNGNYYSQGSKNYGQPAYSASSNAAEDYNADYQSQHSPILTSTTLGSPTIQQYEEQFYNSNQNPDLVGQTLSNSGGSDRYFMEDYAANDLVRADLIPQTNNYYYNGNSPYYTNQYPVGDYFSMSFYLSNYYSLRPWYDPFNPFFSPYYYSPRLGTRPFANVWCPYPTVNSSYYGSNGLPGYVNTFYSINYYSGIYDSNGSGYSSAYNGSSSTAYNYYGNVNNSSYAVYESNTKDDGSYGGRVTDGSPISRSSVSHYANSGRKIQRREDYSPNDNIGGRKIENNLPNSTERYSSNSKRRSDTGSITRTAADYTRDGYQKKPVGSSSMTIQQNNNTNRRTILTVGNSIRPSTGIKPNSNKRRKSGNYTNRTNTRQNIVGDRSNQSRFSNNSNNTQSGSSINRTRTNTSFNNGSRNSRPNRSYSAPKTGVSNRSTAPRSRTVQRSSSQRSSSGGTRSTGSRSTGRKN